MGKAAENKVAGKAPAKQPTPSAAAGKAGKAVKAKAAKDKATEAAADAIIAELTKVKPTKSTSGKTSKKTAEAKEVKKTVAKKVKPVAISKKKNPERRDLHIPKEVRRRFLRRAGNVRVSDSVLGPLDEVGKETMDELMLHCVRTAVLAGRCTVQTKDLKRALDIEGIQIY